MTDKRLPDALEPEAEDAPAGSEFEGAAEARRDHGGDGTKRVMAINAEASETGDDAGLQYAPNTFTGTIDFSIKREENDGSPAPWSASSRTPTSAGHGLRGWTPWFATTACASSDRQHRSRRTHGHARLGQELNARDLDPDVVRVAACEPDLLDRKLDGRGWQVLPPSFSLLFGSLRK